MTAFVRNIAFDCADPYALALFWKAVTGGELDPRSGPDDDEVVVTTGPSGLRFYFGRVPEGKQVKNRVHVCMQPHEQRDAEVLRLLALGAAMHDDRREPDGSGWVVLTDPEGNEFCLVHE
jgi:predicted enzyme related to lactoylglutathione lyase